MDKPMTTIEEIRATLRRMEVWKPFTPMTTGEYIRDVTYPLSKLEQDDVIGCPDQD